MSDERATPPNDDSWTMSNDTHDSDRAEPTHLRSDGGQSTDSVFGSRDLRSVLNYLALAGLVLFALVSAVQLYAAVGGIINELIAREYRVFFRAAFNLVVLLLCVGGISLQLDRIT
ncbi:hypothetical protein [Halohasta litorea]|uniref:DUF8060 domain-containing protein n=1 Tax=Halohasta litorea TaxID=869891 RepID=A0ABD6D3T0_9EURY|nr:hypothetical protein [Halohasta litorea]MEA1930776.1 hypothetical protein [Euryarchaeota archaeon]